MYYLLHVLLVGTILRITITTQNITKKLKKNESGSRTPLDPYNNGTMSHVKSYCSPPGFALTGVELIATWIRKHGVDMATCAHCTGYYLATQHRGNSLQATHPRDIRITKAGPKLQKEIKQSGAS